VSTLEELFGDRAAVVVPDVLGSGLAAELRARLDRGGYARYALADRGSYEVREAPDEPALFGALAALAARTTGRTLAVTEARALRLRAGDYLLAHHDRLRDDHPVEIMLDVSAASVAGAEVHYRRRGQVFLRVASAPGAASIVERGPTVNCNHTYVSKLHAGAEVVRLVVRLKEVR
jgi:hypothetical protein